jgi:hypothetical protein
LAVRTGKLFLVRKVILEFLQGRPDARCFRPYGGRPDASIVHLNSQFTSFFVSFPMTPTSSQSDILVKSYDQNTGGCSDDLTERPDG